MFASRAIVASEHILWMLTAFDLDQPAMAQVQQH